jgi:hypothetical protein
VGGAADTGLSVAGAGRVRPEVVWAAPDSPAGSPPRPPAWAATLPSCSASLTALPLAGDQYRVIAWPDARDGRKLTAGSTLPGPGGEVLAAARAGWLTVPRPVPASAAEGVSSPRRRGMAFR